MHRVERLNSLSHLFGAVAAAVGLAVLVVFASLQGDPWKIVSFSVYGTTLLVLYSASSIYHGFHGKTKAFFRKLDHVAIYLLIAGTYTPFTLVTLHGAWGWSLFGVVWGLALVGILVDTLLEEGRRIIPVVIYILMGWSCVVALDPLLENLAQAGFMWLLAGGIFYTVGIVFYALDSRQPYFHVIWHVFVLAGSACHYLAILLYIL